MQLGLAGAVAAHAVDVHAGRHHVGGDDGGSCLVCGDGGDDVGTKGGLRSAAALHQAQRGAAEVAHQLGGGHRVDVVQAQLFNAHQVVKGQGLEFALCAVADQRHDPAVRTGQGLCRHHRGGGSAQRRGQRQLAHQQWDAGIHIGQHAKGHHRGQAALGIAGVAIDVFEAVGFGIGDGHQFDHALGRVVGHAGRLVKFFPAQKVVAYGLCHAGKNRSQTPRLHNFCHMLRAQKGGGNMAYWLGQIVHGVAPRSVLTLV